MATWDELVAHLRARSMKFEVLGSEQIAVTFQYDDTRRQKVTARRVRVRSANLCELVGLLSDEGARPARDVLTLNAELEFGGVCLIGTNYALRYTAELAHLDAAGFEFYLQEFAALADRLERRLASSDRF